MSETKTIKTLSSADSASELLVRENGEVAAAPLSSLSAPVDSEQVSFVGMTTPQVKEWLTAHLNGTHGKITSFTASMDAAAFSHFNEDDYVFQEKERWYTGTDGLQRRAVVHWTWLKANAYQGSDYGAFIVSSYYTSAIYFVTFNGVDWAVRKISLETV